MRSGSVEIAVNLSRERGTVDLVGVVDHKWFAVEDGTGTAKYAKWLSPFEVSQAAGAFPSIRGLSYDCNH